MKSQYDLLQEAIELTPRNRNGSRNCQTTIEKLATLIHSPDEEDGLTKAVAMFGHFCLEGTTPSRVSVKPGLGAYRYEPYRIVVGNDGTYKLYGKATLEYLQAEAERAEQNLRMLHRSENC
jgi:hypothetical protein